MQTRGHASNIDSPPHIGYDVGDCTSSYLPANKGSRCGLGCILAREHVKRHLYASYGVCFVIVTARLGV